MMTDYAYDTYVAQNFSKVTEFAAKSVGPSYPEVRAWIQKFTLTSILAPPYPMDLPQNTRANTLASLRRTIRAIDAFDSGCLALRAFVEGPDGRTVANYFRALDGFEAAATNIYQIYELFRRGQRLFGPADQEHTLHKLNIIYNATKHTDPSTLKPGHLLRVWLENDGIHADDTKRAEATVCSYEELRQIVEMVAYASNLTAQCKVTTENMHALANRPGAQWHPPPTA